MQKDTETVVMGCFIKYYFDDHEWGTGSQNGDVLLVNVPADGFYTSIVEITDENRHLVKEIEHIRAEGEAPYKTRVIDDGFAKQPAKYAQIVIYRADVLALDNDRFYRENHVHVME